MVKTVPQKIDENFNALLESIIHSFNEPRFPIKSKKLVMECATQWLIDDWQEVVKERDDRRRKQKYEVFKEKLVKTIETMLKKDLIAEDSRGMKIA